MPDMNILVIGNGGREHALAWKLAQSAQVARVWVAPGNGGTATPCQADGPDRKIRNVPTAKMETLIVFADQARIGLVVIGPEAQLAAGIADTLRAAGLRCFGPTRAAAQLEASKAFAKAFMIRHDIPTGRYATFTEHVAAVAHLRRVDYPVVIKASGLAAGKGVIVPGSQEEAEQAVHQIMVDRAFGNAGDEVVIEERLYGQEVSVLAFSDGQTVKSMPTAQDHKPVFDGDQGPNTGGMGAYAPAPLVNPVLMNEIARTVLQPTINGMAAEGKPFAGVLYAGLMITEAGPRVLEYNCRFGDPETQVILPLLESDLVDIVNACVDGTLDQTDVRWRPGAVATVVMASGGYPGTYLTGQEITGVAEAEKLSDVTVFHAGTRQAAGGPLLTAGGRVLAVTGLGHSLPEALQQAYAAIDRIHFDGMHYRRDIGAKALL